MSFTAIFVALLIERFFDFSRQRNLGWYTNFQRLIMQKLPGQTPYVTLAATVLPLVLGTWLVSLILQDMLFGFIKLIFSIFVILYCLGPRNLWADLFAANTALDSGDSSEMKARLDSTFAVSDAKNDQATHRELINHFFIAANKRVFAILFWFGCFGVAGVVLYRFLTASADTEKEATSPAVVSTAMQAEGMLDWPAVRAITFIFALGGNFARVIGIWLKKVGSGVAGNDSLLIDCGNAALNTVDAEKIAVDGTTEKEVVSLLDRSLIIALVVVAVLSYLL